MARITDASYERSRRYERPPATAQNLATRLRCEPRTVYELARRLGWSLYWLDVASGPDVVRGTPASWDACIACGIDPVTGEPLAGPS